MTTRAAACAFALLAVTTSPALSADETAAPQGGATSSVGAGDPGPSITVRAPPTTFEFPSATMPITDLAGVLPPASEASLTALLERHRDATGVAIGLFVITSLNGATMPDVAAPAGLTFASGWARDLPWVLIVVSTGDRLMRIEGSPLVRAEVTDEEVLTLTRRARDAFASGDMPGGLRTLVADLVAETQRAPARSTPWTKIILVALVLVATGGAGWWLELGRRTASPPKQDATDV